MRFPVVPTTTTSQRRTKSRWRQVFIWIGVLLVVLIYVSFFWNLGSIGQEQQQSPSPSSTTPSTPSKITSTTSQTSDNSNDQDADVTLVVDTPPPTATVVTKTSTLSEDEINRVLWSADYSDVDRFGNPPIHQKIQLPTDTSCPVYSNMKARNYTENPVVVIHPSSGVYSGVELWRECDCPCAYTSDSGYKIRGDGFVSVIPGGDSTNMASCQEQQYSVLYSMESDVNYPVLNRERFHTSGYQILATYDLDSDVPAPFYSWEEYDFFRPIVPKTESSDMLVMISNCGAVNGRLDYIRKMVDAGISIDSFGRCMHNKDIDRSSSHFLATKIHIQSHYKFSNVFENSNTKDYVTEKLFGSFVAGSIPIHMGVRDVQKFGPSKKSIISVHDFASHEELVKYMKYLSSNTTAYDEYLTWKKLGISKEFRAMVDLSRVHSWCRICIRIGDLNRWKYSWDELFSEENPHFKENSKAKSAAPSGATLVKTRERGKYWFKALYLASKTYDALLEQIKSRFTGWIEIWDIYRIKKNLLDDVIHFNNDQQLSDLVNGTEIEIIFLDVLEGSPSTKWELYREHLLHEAENKNNKVESKK